MPVISVGEYEPPVPHVCGGCGGQIADRYYLLAVDRQWHARCLTCCECKLQLDSELTCFARDGNIYCKEDYYRLFAVKRCARCQRGIFANELVMRARELVYHLHCFTCAWCNTALTQGDYFGLRDNLVYCRAHYELMVHGDGSSAATFHEQTMLPRYPSLTLLQPSPEPGGGGAFAPFPGVRKGRPRKRKATDVREGLLSQTIMLEGGGGEGCNLHLSPLEQGGGGGMGGGPQRTKRMRTSFKHHQLRTMKSYFAINQNPDAKDLKQLAQKTGLSKRVLQVWFQNARAKWRRNNLRQVDPTGGGGSAPPLPHPASPGAASSFSEASPAPPLPPQPLPQPPVDYDSRHRLSPASFQELF